MQETFLLLKVSREFCEATENYEFAVELGSEINVYTVDIHGFPIDMFLLP